MHQRLLMRKMMTQQKVGWISKRQETIAKRNPREKMNILRPLERKTVHSAPGRNPFFILEPNYPLVLGGEDAGEAAQLTITVLNETREVNGTQTRVIEERESVGGELVEISRNFFATCEETNNVFYFGEEVDIYENGMIVDHEGAWLAGEGTNRAGIIMPGTILLGARYYQEIAPSVALDRAEIIDTG